MKRSETSPNRKAFPKFLKWLLISAVFGFASASPAAFWMI